MRKEQHQDEICQGSVRPTVVGEGLNAFDRVGYRRFVFIKQSARNVVAAAERYAALQDNKDRKHRELQEAIEFMHAKQEEVPQGGLGLGGADLGGGV